ncbi:MAG: acyl-CoA carboxylase subunit beta [Dehalococcoidales bacterium]|jgi:acetyl-CoA carboxylase carboxyltransferase component|nr:acyl-CoA carboxylase subunit beta [Dehalococcoidales bacterium]
MATTKELIEEYQRKRHKIEEMGAAETIEKRHQGGQWTARERIDYFFDPGTFNEIGIFVKHRATSFGMDKREVPAEGVVTGHGLVNGRPVVAFAEDFMALAGTFGEYHGMKEIRAINFAREMGWPVVGMNDSGGARLQEGIDTLEAYGMLFNAQIQASGIIPQIALLMGPCLGGQAYHPIMQDFLIQCKTTGYMGIAGPAIVQAQLGEEISLEKLSGWEAHAVKSGQSHIVAEDDKDAIDKAKELLALLPPNNLERSPVVASNDDPEREILELNDVIPDSPTRPYDMFKVIRAISDDGYFFETLKSHARSVITGFARFNGRTVGLWANQPMQMAGSIDINAADKGARFVRFCDLFNIPVVTLGDCGGYMIGSEQDWKGILRHGAKLLFAWADATIPLISIILRKSYAGAHYGMLDKGIGADLVFAWPTARVNIVGAKTAASVIFAREIRESENPEETRAKRENEYEELYENPYRGAERGYIDDVIMPSDTRKVINRALDVLEDKDKDHRTFKARPWRKYSNINL